MSNVPGLHQPIARLFRISLRLMLLVSITVFFVSAAVEIYLAKRTLGSYLSSSVVGAIGESAQRGDVLFLQSSLLNIHDNLEMILPNQVRLMRRDDGKFVADVGQLTPLQEYFATEMSNDVNIPSSYGTIQVLLKYSVLPILVFSALRTLVIVALGLFGMLCLQSQVSQLVFKVSVPFDELLEWLEAQIKGKPINDITIANLKADGAYHQLISGVKKLVMSQRQLASLEEANRIAQQVAHDIRSPLSALKILQRKMHHINESQSQLVSHVIQRIEDIASDLVTTHSDVTENTWLNSVLSGSIQEKSLHIKSNGINFEVSLGVDSFVRMNVREFLRTISNILNNATDAIKDSQGTISLRTFQTENEVCIEIQDTGCGLPQSIMENIGQRGYSYGKENGSGLGLYHAKSSIERWGGRFHIASVQNQGTTVSIHLPITNIATPNPLPIKLSQEV